MRDLYDIENKINEMSELEQIEKIKENWRIIRIIYSPSEVVIRAAVEMDGRAILYMSGEVSEELENLAVGNMGDDYKFRDEPELRYESSREIYRRIKKVYGVMR
jgi:hypothetical protein